MNRGFSFTLQPRRSVQEPRLELVFFLHFNASMFNVIMGMRIFLATQYIVLNQHRNQMVEVFTFSQTTEKMNSSAS